MNGEKIDRILEGIVHPLGPWQLGIVILTSLSFPASFLLPVFFNSYPNHRCRAEPKLEAWFDQVTQEFGKGDTNEPLFSRIASLLGPVSANGAFMSGCDLFAIERKTNESLLQMLSRYKQAAVLDKRHGRCPYGYVYEYSEFQYKGGIVQEWDLVCENAWQIPVNESAYMAGMLIGYIVGGWLSDCFGRRRTMIYSGLIESLVGVAICFCPNHGIYIALRFFLAMFFTSRTSSFTVLETEITTARYRSILAAVGTVIQLGVQRVILGTMADHITSWRLLNAMTILPNIIAFFSFCFIPESPRWLVEQGKGNIAGDVLYNGYKMNNHFRMCCCCAEDERAPFLTREDFLKSIGVCLPINEASSSTQQCEALDQTVSCQRISTLKLFSPDLIKTTVLSIVLMTGQVTCTFGMAFYASNVRQYISIVVVINALSNIPGALVSAFLYRVFEYRKKPLAGAYVITAIVLWTTALHTLLFKPETDQLLNIMVNVATFLLSATQRMIFVYVPELFNPLFRNRGLGIAAGLARIGALSYPLINRLDADIAHGLPLAVYAGIATFQLFVLMFLADANGQMGPVVEVEVDEVVDEILRFPNKSLKPIDETEVQNPISSHP